MTLFTGQWADLPLTELAKKASNWGGYDGLELACWGDHFDPAQGATDPAYCDQQKNILEEQIEEGFKYFADMWHPILDLFDENGVKFALEVHPTEFAFDYV